MKFTTKFLLIVAFWAALAALGVRNCWRAFEIEREFAELALLHPLHYLFPADRPRIQYVRQQIRLCEMALATEPDNSIMQEADAKFRGIQQRYGQLTINDPHDVAVVNIPEICLPERLEYAWRIHVPAEQQVELAGYVGAGGNTASRAFVPSDVTRALPAGESVIRIVCERGQLFEWGSVAPKDLARFYNRLTVFINEDDFGWQSTYYEITQVIDPNLYPSQQTLFGSAAAELLQVRDFTAAGSKGDLHLVVRQTKRAPAE